MVLGLIKKLKIVRKKIKKNKIWEFLGVAKIRKILRKSFWKYDEYGNEYGSLWIAKNIGIKNLIIQTEASL